MKLLLGVAEQLRGDAAAIDLLSQIAEDCTRAEDCAFWILTSAAAHLGGHHDTEGSTVAHYFPERLKF